MTDPITAFFSAWSMTDTAARQAVLSQSAAPDISYADPRSPNVLTGLDQVNSYLAAFSEMAPGMAARVIDDAAVQGSHRVTVAFGMPGSDQAQRGQYFVELATDGKIARMVGFAGMGEPT